VYPGYIILLAGVVMVSEVWYGVWPPLALVHCEMGSGGLHNVVSRIQASQ